MIEAKTRAMVRPIPYYPMAVWRNGSASDYESGGCRFEPYLGHIFSFSTLGVPTRPEFFFLLGCTLLIQGTPSSKTLFLVFMGVKLRDRTEYYFCMVDI